MMTNLRIPGMITNALISLTDNRGILLWVINLSIGLFTPPVGTALFVGCAVGKTELGPTSKRMLGLFLTMVFALMVVTFWPPLSTWLPSITKA
jgi:TRAP-type C4-dicarboxylate transport system permease large subunit